MAKQENFDSDLHDPDASGMGAAEAEAAQEAIEEPKADSQTVAPEVATAVAEAEASTEEVPAEKPPAKWPFYLEVAVLILVPVALLALVWQQLIFISTAIYIFAIAAIPYVLWKTQRTSTIYTVFLGCVLAAILTAVYCLWVELGRYDFDIKAQEAKQRTVRLWPVVRPILDECLLTLEEVV